MRDVLILFLHLIITVARLAWPGGLCSVVAESLLVKHRGGKRAVLKNASGPLRTS